MSSTVPVENSSVKNLSPIQVAAPNQKQYRLFLGGSIVFLIGLLFAIMGVSRGLVHSKAVTHLITQLDSGTAESREQALKSYRANFRSGWFTRSLGLIFEDIGAARLDAVDNIYNIVSQIIVGNFIDAGNTYRDRLKPSVFELLTLIDLRSQQRDLVQTTMRNADRWSEDVIELARLEVEVPEKLAALTDKRNQLTLLSKDLFSDFSNLMGFANIRDSVPEVPAFYNSGVLQGLPQLNRLPDGISDLTELRNLLTAQNVTVNVRGENAHKVFNERLTELRKQSAAFKDQLADIDQEIASANQSLTDLRLEVYQAAQNVKADMLGLLRLIAK